MAATLFGHRIVWCNNPREHIAHSRYNQVTRETTWCNGTTFHEALDWERERSWSQSDDGEES